MTVRTKILFWFLPPIISVVIITAVISYRYTSKIVENDIFVQLGIAADGLREQIKSFLKEKTTRTTDFSSDGYIRIRTERIIHGMGVDTYTFQLNRHLRYNKKSLDEENILEVFIVDLSGKVISSTEISRVGKYVSDEVYFSKTTERGSCISNLHYSPEFRQNTFEVSRLLVDNEGMEIIGIIVNRYRGDSLNDITHSGISEESGDVQRLEGLGETGEVYIVNSDKFMITRSRFVEDAILRQVVDTEGVKTAFENGKGMTGIYTDYRGVSILGVSRYIEEMDWVALAEKDVSEAFAPIKRLRNITILIGTIGIIVTVIIVIFITTGITKPIRKLVEGTRRISKGDLSFNIEARTNDEFGYLARSFNDMTIQLGKSKEQIQDYAHNLEKKVEEKTNEIKKEKEYTEELIETAQDAIISIDENEIINVWNHSAENIFGYLKSEIIGQSVTTIIPEKYKKKYQEGIIRFIETNKSKLIGNTIEVTGRTKEGNEILIELSLSFQKTDDERFSFTAIIRDITKRKQMEEELKVSQKMSSIGRLSEGVFHEILNPVNIISAHVQLLMMETEKDSSTERDLKSIKEEIERIVSITDELLKFSQKEEGVVEKIEINDLQENTLSLVRPEMNAKSIKPITKLEKDLPAVMAHGDELRQVFLNLITNAIDAMPKGGTLTINTQSIKKNGNLFVSIKVTDTGHGIAKTDIDKVFEPFFSTKKEIKGVGLGLSTSYAIIEGYGGKISVESEEGKGTSFTIHLPVKD